MQDLLLMLQMLDGEVYTMHSMELILFQKRMVQLKLVLTIQLEEKKL